MKKSLPPPTTCPDQEKGVVVLMSLMLGLVMIAGVSALLVNQIFARRLSSSESYQQMAESAAVNGFNRILALLNNKEPGAYRGFLFTLDNQQNTAASDNGYSWMVLNDSELAPTLEEICTNTAVGLPVHPTSNQLWPVDDVPFSLDNSTAQRSDQKGKIQSFYRLRGYASPSSSGIGQGIFEVEGIVKRVHSSGFSQPLARTLLTRSLYVNASVISDNDWASIAANHLEIGAARMTGPGRILHLVESATPYQSQGGCSPQNRLGLAAGNSQRDPTLGDRLWPVLNRELPPSNLFNTDAIADQRIWSVDDDPQNTLCGADVCVRTNSNPQPAPGVTTSGNVIRIPRNSICANTPDSNPCHVYMEHVSLANKRLLIENDEQLIVIRLELPQGAPPYPGMSGRMKLSGNQRFCGVNSGKTSCNMKPERLVVTKTSGVAPKSCLNSEAEIGLKGNSLPAAIISLPQGNLKLTGHSSLRGMVWVNALCTNDYRFTLRTTTTNGEHVSAAASDQWQWPKRGFQGLGRMVNRGILGTDLDSFRQW